MPPVLADAGAAAVLAAGALPPVLADAAAAALFALAALPPVRTGHASSEIPDAKRTWARGAPVPGTRLEVGQNNAIANRQQSSRRPKHRGASGAQRR